MRHRMLFQKSNRRLATGKAISVLWGLQGWSGTQANPGDSLEVLSMIPESLRASRSFRWVEPHGWASGGLGRPTWGQSVCMTTAHLQADGAAGSAGYGP